MSVIDVAQFDKIEATFAPSRTDDLRPAAQTAIGQRLTWEAIFVIEKGPYVGEWAFSPDYEKGFMFTWVPLSDLADIERVDIWP